MRCVDRPELGVLLSRLLREVLARETPILEREALPMWDYVVLSALGGGQAPTQARLAAATGRDKTRLIANLDHLESLGLVARSPDPADRRNRIVAITRAGERTLHRCRAAIASMEDDLLGDLDASARETFESVLVDLAGRLGPTEALR